MLSWGPQPLAQSHFLLLFPPKGGSFMHPPHIYRLSSTFLRQGGRLGPLGIDGLPMDPQEEHHSNNPDGGIGKELALWQSRSRTQALESRSPGFKSSSDHSQLCGLKQTI